MGAETVIRIIFAVCKIFHLVWILAASVCAAGDCRAVVQVRSSAVNYYAANVSAYRQVYYTPTYQQVALIAVEDPYRVELLAPELRAKQRAKEQTEELKILRETAKANTEAIKLLTAALMAGKGTPPVKEDTDEVVPILRKYCASCHTGEGSKGQVMLFNPDKTPVQFTPLLKSLVESVVNDNSMPQKGDKPTPEEYQKIRKWYEADRASFRAELKQKIAVPRKEPETEGELK
jgi:hypothetical protein